MSASHYLSTLTPPPIGPGNSWRDKGRSMLQGPAGAPPVLGVGTGPTSEARSGKGHFGVGGNFTNTGTNAAPDPGAGGAPAGGSQSGPGILENWFNQRANGTDPGYEYAMNRGMNSIDDRMAAGGSFNSGARGQQLGDFAANMGAQREGQLDALAGGASGEHLGRLNLMFNQGMGLAGGQSGLSSAYDLGAAGNMAAANNAMNQMNLDKAGVDSKYAQGRLNSLISAYGAYQSGNKS